MMLFIQLLANIADPDQTAPWEQSDLDLQCLLIKAILFQTFGVTMVGELDT